jgi:hypothetical protein
VGLLLFEVSLDALDGIDIDGTHVVPHVGHTQGLKQSHDRFGVEVQLLGHFVNPHLAHRPSGDLHASPLLLPIDVPALNFCASAKSATNPLTSRAMFSLKIAKNSTVSCPKISPWCWAVP